MGETNTAFETEELLNFLESNQQVTQAGVNFNFKTFALKNNGVKMDMFVVPPQLFFGNAEYKEYDCIGEKKSFVYENNKKTDKFLYTTYECLTRNGSIKFRVASERMLFPEKFFEQNLDLLESVPRIRVRVGHAKIKITKIEYSNIMFAIWLDEEDIEVI